MHIFLGAYFLVFGAYFWGCQVHIFWRISALPHTQQWLVGRTHGRPLRAEEAIMYSGAPIQSPE